MGRQSNRSESEDLPTHFLIQAFGEKARKSVNSQDDFFLFFGSIFQLLIISKMKRKLLFRSLLSVAFLFSSCSLFAQTVQILKQVIVAAGGNFSDDGDKAIIAAYNPVSKALNVFDSIPARSVSDIEIDGNYAYLAADSLLIRYDIDTYTKTHSAVVPGIRMIEVAGNKLFVTRGFGADSNYVHQYNKNDLSFVKAYSEITAEAEAILAISDTVYVSVVGDFINPKKNLAYIQLSNDLFKSEITLGDSSAGNIFMFRHHEFLVSVNTIQYNSSYATIEFHNTFTGDKSYETVNATVTGIGGIEFDNLILITSTGVRYYDLQNGTLGNLKIIGNFRVGDVDFTKGDLYLTQTDFFSYGRMLRVYGGSSTQIDTINIGIAPEAIATDFRIVGSVNENKFNTHNLVIYPNPASDIINIKCEKSGQIEIFDQTGKLIDSFSSDKNKIDITSYTSGIYFIRFTGQDSVGHSRFVKQ